jgi:hypothetical protein
VPSSGPIQRFLDNIGRIERFVAGPKNIKPSPTNQAQSVWQLSLLRPCAASQFCAKLSNLFRPMQGGVEFSRIFAFVRIPR